MRLDSISQNIKAYREESGLTQDKVAAKADLSTRFYRYIESGEKMPSVLTTLKIAYALDIDYTDILDELWENLKQNPDSYIDY